MARHEAALNPSCRPLLAILAFPKLPAQAQTCRGVGVGASLTLPLHIAPALCGSIKNVVGRLNEASRFKFAQEIAGGDEAHTFIDNDLASGNVGILKQQQRLGCRIALKKAIQHLQRRLFAEGASGPAFLETPLLVDPDFRRYNPNLLKMGVHPFDDLSGSSSSANPRRLNIDGVGNAHGQARAQQCV